jgi:uncharacterized protein
VPCLPARIQLQHLRDQADSLLRDAGGGDQDALERIRAVSDTPTLADAELALAREYGFADWSLLELEVRRRDVLNSRDLNRLAALLANHPELAYTPLEHWCDHKRAGTIAYMAMLRFDHQRLGLPRELPGTGAVVKALIAAGAPVDGDADDSETPLITAASYGDAEVARVLIDAGANVDARSRDESSELGGLSALMHAAVFGMTDVLDALIAAGARPDGIESAAAAGDISGWLTPDTPADARIRALVMAADHQRLDVIDQLLDAGTPIDAVDDFDRQPLRIAAQNGRSASVEHLLARGADPGALDRLSETDG